MNYRQLQSALKQLRDNHGVSLNCSLKSRWAALALEYKRVMVAPYFLASVNLETGFYVVDSTSNYALEFGAVVESITEIKPAQQREPFNAHVEMWSLLARASELCKGIAYPGEPFWVGTSLGELAEKIERFIYWNIGYRFSEHAQARRIDDLEGVHHFQSRRKFGLARCYLNHFHSAFYIDGLDDESSPYFKDCKDLIASLT